MWAPNVLFAVIGGAILFFVSRAGARRMNPLVARLRRLTGPRRSEDAETVGEAA